MKNNFSQLKDLKECPNSFLGKSQLLHSKTSFGKIESSKNSDVEVNNTISLLLDTKVASEFIDGNVSEENKEKVAFLKEALDDQSVAFQVYQNKDVMHSLAQATIKKIDIDLKNTTDKEKINNLQFTKTVLTAGLNIDEENQKESSVKAKKTEFKGHFDLFGYFGASNKDERVNNIINRNATAAAGAAALLAQTGVGDKAALTLITTRMCTNISNEYGLSGLSTGAGILAVAVGFAVGTQAAATAITIIPGAGNAVNATLAYTLHQLAGRALVAIYDEPSIQKDLKWLNNTEVMLGKFKEVIKGLEAFHSLPTPVQDQILNNGINIIRNGIDIVNKVTQFLS